MKNRADHSHLLRLISTQRRDLTRTHRRLMSRGGWTVSITSSGLETTTLEKASSPAVMDLVLESGLAGVETCVPCALTGLFRWKQPRGRPSESVPRRSTPAQTHSYRRSTARNETKTLSRTRPERDRRGELQRKEELYGRLEALVTPNRTSVLDSISWTSGRLQATNASIR